MLALHGVTKRFGDTVALDDVSLDVTAGRTTALIGPSGCGKSTVLRLLVGLVRPSDGEVMVGDVLVGRDTERAVRRTVGYVIQEGGLFPHMTARRNVTLAARHAGWTPERIGERLETLVALTSFPGDALDRYPLQLSGGQRQRLALMRGLMLDPDVLLLDEPFAALDPVVRHELQEELRAIFERLGKTVVLVTHDLAEASFLGHEIVLMDAGRIVQRGAFRDFVDAPATPFVTRFVRAQRAPWDAS